MNLYRRIYPLNEGIEEPVSYDGSPINAPGENPYELLNGYMNPDNKIKFDISYGGGSFGKLKITNVEPPSNGSITFSGDRYLSGKKVGTADVTIMLQQFLAAMTGAKIPVTNLRINGEEQDRIQYIDKRGHEALTNFYFSLQEFDNKKTTSFQRGYLLPNLIDVYNNLPRMKKGLIDQKLQQFRYSEMAIKNKGKAGYPEVYSSVESALAGLKGSMKLFSVGNAKVSRDTLLVNMTSAVDCPSKGGAAVNKDVPKSELDGNPDVDRTKVSCKVGGICYAQASERQYWNEKHRNRVLNIINLICLQSGRMDLLKDTIETYIDSAREAGFNIRNIRLSENGDFINQKCIDEYANMCGEIEEDYDGSIQATAYSARSRVPDYMGGEKDADFSSTRRDTPSDNPKIGTAPKIVVTSSLAENGSLVAARFNPETGQVEKLPGNLVDKADRYFLAIPSSDFNELPDTPVVKKGQANLASNEFFATKNVPTGAFHKCQCEIDKGKVCGDCQICYTPNPGAPYYVFCKMHGPDANKLSDEALNGIAKARNFGNQGEDRLNPDMPSFAFDASTTTPPQFTPRPYDAELDAELRNNARFGNREESDDDWFKRGNRETAQVSARRQEMLAKWYEEHPEYAKKPSRRSVAESIINIRRMISEGFNRIKRRYINPSSSLMRIIREEIYNEFKNVL